MSEEAGSEPRHVQLVVTPHFRRRVKNLAADEQHALARALRIFERDPTDPRIDTHKLRGEHAGKLAFSFGYDARVVFQWEGQAAILLDVGNHDEVYG
jgi:mRNA-degrading endonuclease YafQ of YafQ-DinJ toxin-antitoxin module